LKSMKRILVTGGFGFIGTTLLELLVQDKSNSVHVVDDLSTSPVDLQDYLEQIGNSSNLTYDICTIEEYFVRNNIPNYDEVYHLASPVGPLGVLNSAGDIVRIIVRDCYIIMDYCIERGAKLLNVSTSEIYGGGVEGFCSEDTPRVVSPTTTVRMEYAMGKLAAETALINTCRINKLHALIVRPFNVAGPRQSPRGGFVVPRLIQQADANIPLTVYGDGSAVRAFTHVRDVSEGIILVLRNGKSGEAYNVGSPSNKINILDLARRVIKLLGSRSKVSFVDPKFIYGDFFAEANDKYPSIEKAETELGWKGKIDIDRVIWDAYLEFKRQKEAGILKFEIT